MAVELSVTFLLAEPWVGKGTLEKGVFLIELYEGSHSSVGCLTRVVES